MAQEGAGGGGVPFNDPATTTTTTTGNNTNTTTIPTNLQEEKKHKYQTEIQQMMYVFGEVQDVLPEVSMLVEDIVKRHIIELITNSNTIMRLRSSRYISVEDVVFLIRHDSSKINRLKDYLSWKDLRKNIKDENAVENDLGEEDAPEVTERAKKRPRFNWEPIKEFTDHLEDDSEDEDEEDLEAHRESL
ncbi:Transcription initiation protein spt3, partial [Coelomomyces lativittatus]